MSATSRKGQRDADLQPVQNTEHNLLSKKQEGPARWLFTYCSNTEHAFLSKDQEGPARCWLTFCSKPRACFCQQQTGRVSQMLTYILFKTKSMLLSATTTKGQKNADLHPIQNPEHTLVSKKNKVPARCWLTSCLKSRAWSYQQQAGKPSQMLTYSLFKPQSILWSATSRKGQPDADLHSVQNPEHALVSNKQKGPAQCLLTACSKPRACYFSNKQEGPARCWLTICSKPKASFCQLQAGRASQMLTYILFKAQSMLLSAASRKG